MDAGDEGRGLREPNANWGGLDERRVAAGEDVAAGDGAATIADAGMSAGDGVEVRGCLAGATASTR